MGVLWKFGNIGNWSCPREILGPQIVVILFGKKGEYTTLYTLGEPSILSNYLKKREATLIINRFLHGEACRKQLQIQDIVRSTKLIDVVDQKTQ